MNKVIKKTLIDKDLSITEVARKISRSRTWTSLVINGHEKSEDARKAISKALGVPYNDLWREPKYKKAA